VGIHFWVVVLGLEIYFFSEVMNDLYNLVDEDSGVKCPLISDKHLDIINKNAGRLDSAIVYDRDFHYNYFGFKVHVTKYNNPLVDSSRVDSDSSIFYKNVT